jgi:hypothetical protein
MDPNPKFIRLLQRIQESTKAGRIHWEETVDENSFRLVLNPGMIRITRQDSDNSDLPIYVAILIDGGGKVVDTAVGTASEAILLDEIWRLARRDAMKADGLIDVMIGNLESNSSR